MQRGSCDSDRMVSNLMDHVPDGNSSDGSSKLAPSAVWKRGVLEAEAGQVWYEVKDDLIHRFGSGGSDGPLYSLIERLIILKSVWKRPHEDLWAYVIRVRCLASALMEGQIPTNLEDLPALDNVLVRLLFLFGLSETDLDKVPPTF